MSLTRLAKVAPELNNNCPEDFDVPTIFKRNRNESVVSVSSASSCQSEDSVEDADGHTRKPLLTTQNDEKKQDFRRLRSMSDGATVHLPDQEPFHVLPSLPDSVLEKMELLDPTSKERLNDEGLEQKFISLSLAFTIDSTTIEDRCDRQKRYRDQTETNLNNEIDRLVEKANRMQALCIDAETTELLSTLLLQIDIVMKASFYATVCSERYGAIQQEKRLQEAVTVMIKHVNLLKQQRDSARRQLQYTKKVLQNTTSETPSSQKLTSPNGNNKIITKRRASIATITQPIEMGKNIETRKILRRTSELSIRATSLGRGLRPNRLELGVDLVKIKEGLTESEPIYTEAAEGSDHNDDNSSHEDSCISTEPDFRTLTLKERIIRRCKNFYEKVEYSFDKWTEDGTVHEICCFCALMCFSFSVIILANILIEVEFAKRNLSTSHFWFRTTTEGYYSV